MTTAFAPVPPVDPDAVGADEAIEPMLGFIRAASDTTWNAAAAAGWTTTDLAETFGYRALVPYCDRFVRYAWTFLPVQETS